MKKEKDKIMNGTHEPHVSEGSKMFAAVRINLNNLTTNQMSHENDFGGQQYMAYYVVNHAT